jgi:hypothetical protein
MLLAVLAQVDVQVVVVVHEGQTHVLLAQSQNMTA